MDSKKKQRVLARLKAQNFTELKGSSKLLDRVKQQKEFLSKKMDFERSSTDCFDTADKNVKDILLEQQEILMRLNTQNLILVEQIQFYKSNLANIQHKFKLVNEENQK